MKAAVYDRYGPPDVLEIRDVEKPVPNDDQVLIEVRAASINPLDWRLMNGKPHLARLAFGLPGPKLTCPGRDVAGKVAAIGKNVTQFQPGDEVFGSCRGALAEYACAPELSLIRKPDAVSFEQAAAVPVAAYTALQGLRDKGRIRAGQQVLINGAAGGVGTFAVQIAKSFGAKVTGVCSTRNLEFVRSIGADRVIDYTQLDFTQNGQRYDLILDCVGNHSLSEFRRALNPHGHCIIAGAPKEFWTILARALEAPILSRLVSQKFVLFLARRSQADLKILCDLMVAEQVIPVIDRCYRLSEASAALQYLEAGHARGKVVVRMSDQSSDLLPADDGLSLLAATP